MCFANKESDRANNGVYPTNKLTHLANNETLKLELIEIAQ